MSPIKPLIGFDIFEKIDIRVGTIVSVEDVDSDKLVLLKVDFGDIIKSVVVGMKKERENPREIEGKQALFIVNLEQKMIHGIMSEAMLFDIGYQDKIIPVLAMPEKPVPNGVRAG